VHGWCFCATVFLAHHVRAEGVQGALGGDDGSKTTLGSAAAREPPRLGARQRFGNGDEATDDVEGSGGRALLDEIQSSG
jgi:hypothetical protein